MSTNYYWETIPEELKDKVAEDWEDIGTRCGKIGKHIGKRSSAGLYCYDCGTTLCRMGTMFVHLGRASFNEIEKEWYPSCPVCGKEVKSGACSFTITAGLHLRALKNITHDRPVVVNEYGEKFTARQMLDIIEECPIQFQSPGQFS